MRLPVSVIDFGTSKIVTLIAENSNTQRCDVIGAGVVPYDGYLPTGWNNLDQLDEAIMESIHEAEEQSKRKIREVRVGVPSAFTKVYVTDVTVELQGAEPKVTDKDVNAIFEAAKASLPAFSGVVLHSSPAWFLVDDGKKTLEPVGIKGRQLRAMISFVVADQFFVDDVYNRMEGLGITASHFFSTAAGEAMLFLPEADRDHTAVLIDMGYLNTAVMVAEGDALIYHDCIGFGGGHIAAELAEKLDIHLLAAEKIKREYVYGVASPDTTYEAISAEDGKMATFTQEEVSAVIEPLLDQLADAINEAWTDSGVRLGSWSNVYLTGGGLISNRGGRDYLGGKLGKPVRQAPKRTAKLNEPTFSSALGLLDLVINSIEQQRESGGMFSGVKRFFDNLMAN